MEYEVVSSHGHRVELRITDCDKIYEIYFECKDYELDLNGQAVAACLLFPFMRKHQNLHLGAVDAEFLDNLEHVQNISASWFSKLEKIQIAGQGVVPSVEGFGVAAFFSGGMDSFYTLEKHRDVIDTLVFVHGFDVELGDQEARALCRELVRATGQQYGKRIIEIETNLREFLDPHLYWGFSHGAAFSAVMHLLDRAYSRFFIASSYAYAQLFPWGSHPLLDPLWSSHTLRIIHDGCEATRIEKAARIAKSPFVMANLRVCWENPGDTNNCGICEKCLRTMTNFEAVGAQEYRRLFPVELSVAKIRKIPFLKDGAIIFARENLESLVASGIRPDLQKAWGSLINRSPLSISMQNKIARHRRKWSRRWQRFWQMFKKPVLSVVPN